MTRSLEVWCVIFNFVKRVWVDLYLLNAHRERKRERDVVLTENYYFSEEAVLLERGSCSNLI